MFKLPVIPTPPLTTRAPVVSDVDDVPPVIKVLPVAES